jgi:hypothetical protein
VATTIAPAPGRTLTLAGAVLAPAELRINVDLIDARTRQSARVTAHPGSPPTSQRRARRLLACLVRR